MTQVWSKRPSDQCQGRTKSRATSRRCLRNAQAWNGAVPLTRATINNPIKWLLIRFVNSLCFYIWRNFLKLLFLSRPTFQTLIPFALNILLVTY